MTENKKKVLFINTSLMVGGGEKLMYEHILFAISKGYSPEVLIINNFQEQYYDKVLKELGVSVHRVSIEKKKVFMNPYYLKWYFMIKFSLQKKYASVIVMNMVLAGLIMKMMKSTEHLHVWHISNICQYAFSSYQYPYDRNILQDKNVTLWFMNRYQKDELQKQYGEIKCKVSLFKLFLTK